MPQQHRNRSYSVVPGAPRPSHVSAPAKERFYKYAIKTERGCVFMDFRSSSTVKGPTGYFQCATNALLRSSREAFIFRNGLCSPTNAAGPLLPGHIVERPRRASTKGIRALPMLLGQPPVPELTLSCIFSVSPDDLLAPYFDKSHGS